VTGPPVLSRRTQRYLAVRRVLELILITVICPLILGIAVLIAGAVWLDDRGRVFFVQDRAGRGGRPFRLVKFRSMRDGKVTRAGRVLRRWHLDELPQLWNVVRGDMSIIGPRPVPLDDYKRYLERIAHYDWRHPIRPGLLGKAQVVLGYTEGVAAESRKWLLDIEYIQAVCWRLDGQIVLATLHLPGQRLRRTRSQFGAAGPTEDAVLDRSYGAPSARSIQPWDHHGAALRQSATAEPSIAHIGQK
jgi:lipopolysaccharide/colanic/teichoic acid biosynthesis glycosyltransferase